MVQYRSWLGPNRGLPWQLSGETNTKWDRIGTLTDKIENSLVSLLKKPTSDKHLFFATWRDLIWESKSWVDEICTDPIERREWWQYKFPSLNQIYFQTDRGNGSSPIKKTITEI